jgi:hypothetical protein
LYATQVVPAKEEVTILCGLGSSLAISLFIANTHKNTLYLKQESISAPAPAQKRRPSLSFVPISQASSQQSAQPPAQQSAQLPAQQSAQLPAQQSAQLPAQQSAQLPAQQSAQPPAQQIAQHPANFPTYPSASAAGPTVQSFVALPGTEGFLSPAVQVAAAQNAGASIITPRSILKNFSLYLGLECMESPQKVHFAALL